MVEDVRSPALFRPMQSGNMEDRYSPFSTALHR